MADPATVSWLHLSDAQFRPSDGWDSHRVLTPLIDDLREMEEKQELSPHLIFFTGDLAFADLPNEKIGDQFQQGQEVSQESI